MRTTCNDIDWFKVSYHCQRNARVGEKALKLLDLITDIINNYEDTKWAWRKDVDWSNSDDVLSLLQDRVTMRSGEFENSSDRYETICYLSDTIPYCKHTEETVKQELRRREKYPYAGCYGYSFVHAGK